MAALVVVDPLLTEALVAADPLLTEALVAADLLPMAELVVVRNTLIYRIGD